MDGWKYQDCFYYRGRKDSVGYCELIETHCQRELEQPHYCPDEEDIPNILLAKDMDNLIEKEV